MTKVKPLQPKKKETFKFGGAKLKILNQTDQVPEKAQKIILSTLENSALAIALKENMACLLTGETGTGKTSAIRYLAYKRKQGYTRINMHGYNTPDELIGTKSVENGSTYWERGILSKAMQEGHIVVLDEINATPPDCLFIIHGLLDDDKFVTLPNGDVLKPHKDFRFFATMNPDYEGTRGLNRAFFDRFPVVLNIDILDPAREKKLLADRLGLPETLITNMVNCAHLNRTAYNEQKTLTLISTRTLLQWGELFKQGLSAKEAFITSVVGKAREEEQTAFIDFYNAVFRTEAGTGKSRIIVRTEEDYKRAISEATAEIATKLKISEEALRKAEKEITLRVTNFSVGDRVEAIIPPDGNTKLVGKRGIVKWIEKSQLGVAFDTRFDGGHQLARLGKRHAKMGFGWVGGSNCYRKVRKYTRKTPVKRIKIVGKSAVPF